MAQIFPSQPQFTGPGGRAERLVFDALRLGLPDSWFVYHHLGYVAVEAAAEGEADFLLVHPQFGLLLIECKAKGVAYSAQAGWQFLDADGKRQPMSQGPAEQAQRTVKNLVRELERRLPQVFPELDRLPLVHGHCVALPEVRAGEVTLPLDLPRDLLIDADDLQGIGQRIQQVMAFWHKNRTSRPAAMSPEAFRRFRKHVLQPELKLMPTLGAQIAGEAATLQRMSQEQCAVIEGFAKMPQLRVTGGAGTGKTILALEAARQCALAGGDVLLLCFTSALGRYLAQSAAELQAAPGRIHATSFHKLCRDAAVALGREWHVPKGATEHAFWRQEAPLLLYEAFDQGKLGPWDALIIDEAQDFADGWWTVLEQGLRTGGRTRQVIFADEGQAVFGQSPALPPWPEYELTRNFRNTRSIAEVVALLGNGKPRPAEGVPLGEPPEVHSLAGPAKLQRQVGELLERLIKQHDVRPEQVVVLTPHTRPNSSLRGVEQLAGLRLVDKPEERDQGLLHTTIGAFKGLEADVVVLLDLKPDDVRCSRAARYVAASRARHRLYVFAEGNWLV